MSSSDGEGFDLENVSGSESEDYAPVKVWFLFGWGVEVMNP